MKTAVIAQGTYYEHMLVDRQSEIRPERLNEICPRICEEHGLTGYTTFQFETPVLVFWSQEELDIDTAQAIVQALGLNETIFNLKHKQSLTEFQAWYDAQDTQTQLSYWKLKYANVAEIASNQVFVGLDRVDHYTLILPVPGYLDQAWAKIEQAREKLDRLIESGGFHNKHWKNAYEQMFALLLGLKNTTPHTAAALGKIYCDTIVNLDDQLDHEGQSKFKRFADESWFFDLTQAKECFEQILSDDATFV